MKVYHGSTDIIEKPNVRFSKDYLGFGKGFYLTSYQKQAEKWALRKSLRKRKEPIVNVYELRDSLEAYRVLSFDNENEKWLDFVCSCRRGEALYKDYDVIIGRVANDDVFKTVDMYFRGLWDKEKTIESLTYYRKNNQICVVQQKALQEILTFTKSYVVVRKNG